MLSFTLITAGCETINISKEEAARDHLITRHVKHALFKNDVVPKSGQHFGVISRKGVVTLTGVADDASQMQNAVAIAKHSQGVSAVENEILVSDHSVINGPTNEE